MTVLDELLVRLGVSKTGLTAGLAAAEGEIKGFSDSTSSSNAKTAGSFSAVGIAAVAVAAGVTVFGVEAVKSASKFEDSMVTVQTQAGLGKTATDAIGQSFLQMGDNSLFSAQQIADAMGPVAERIQLITGHALTAADSLTIMNAATSLAAASQTDLSTATSAVVGVLQAYKLPLDDAAAASNQLFNISRITGVGIDSLGTTVDKLRAKLGTVSPSLSDVGTLMAEANAAGLTGSRGVLTMSSAMTTLLGGSKNVTKELDTLGVHVFDSHGKFVGMASIIEQLNPKLAKLSDAQRLAAEKTLFGAAAAGTMNTVIAGGTAKWDALSATVNAAGAETSAAAAQAATLSGQEKELGDAVDSATTSIGTAFIPIILQAANAILPVVQGIAQWVTANPQLAATILAVVVGVAALVAGVIFLGPILGALGAVLGGLAAVFGLIASPVVLVVGGLVALAAAFGLLGQGPQDAVTGLISTVQGALPGIVTTLGNMAQAFIDWIGPMVPKVIDALTAWAGRVFAWLGAQVPGIVTQLGQWVGAFIGWVGPMIPQIVQNLLGVWVAIESWGLSVVQQILPLVAQWGVAFIQWVGTVIPPLLANLAKLAVQLVQWIAAQLPGLAKNLLDWAGKFAGWVIPMIPTLLGNLAQLMLQVLGWIIAKLPDIAGQLLAWGGAMAQWVLDSIPGLIANLVSMLAQFLGWVAGAAGQVYKSFLDFGGQIVKGIMDAIGNLPKMVGDALNKIPGVSIIGGIVSFGVNAVANVAGAVTGGGGGGGSAHVPAHYALGGMVPGSGPQLAVIHGGELILPPDYLTSGPSGPGLPSMTGGGISGTMSDLTNALKAALPQTIQIYIGNEKLAEITDRQLFQQGRIYAPGIPSQTLGAPTR